MKKLSIATLAVYLFCTNAGAVPPESTPSPKEVVIAFYRMALMDFRPKEAFAKYATADFVEHSADSAGGTSQSTVDFLTDLIKKSPQPKWEIVRVIAEDDMVFLHVRFTPAKDGWANAALSLCSTRGECSRR